MEPAIAEEIRRIAAARLIGISYCARPLKTQLRRWWRGISPSARPKLPPACSENLKASVRANVGHSLTLTAELIALLDLFRSKNILAIPYKGPVLAVQAYGDLTLREFEDLDIIVRQRDMPEVHKIMAGRGFHIDSRAPFPAETPAGISGEYTYRDEARRLMVEIHADRTLRHFPVTPDLDEWRTRLVPVLLSGHEVRTFAVEEGLTFLAVHGSKDLWERLSWIVDISELLRVRPGSGLGFVRSDSRSRLMRSACCTWLLFSRRSFSMRPCRRRFAAAFMRTLRQERSLGILKLDCSAANRRPLGSAARFDLRRRMLAGKRAGWAYSLRLTLGSGAGGLVGTAFAARPHAALFFTASIAVVAQVRLGKGTPVATLLRFLRSA